MRSFTTRLFIVVASLLIAVIIVMQVRWLSKTYGYEKDEFNNSVLKVIRGVYEDIPLLYNTSNPIDSLVEKPDHNSFIFRVDSFPEKDTLRKYLAEELEDFYVFTDCRLALFEQASQSYIYKDYISADASKKNEDTTRGLPLIKASFNYVYINFPNQKTFIMEEMRNWIYSSVGLLILLIAFSFSIYYFMKQKFLVEIQKDFINNVTHEFSTPLSVIDLAVEGLEKPAILSQPEKHARYLSAIKYQSGYLNSHITNLINSVVAGQYHLAIKNKTVVPNELLRKAVLQLETLLVKKGGTITWHLEDSNQSILADEENLYLAFFNIINNAMKYSPVPAVTISTAITDNRYLVSVKDNGPGIAEAQQKKIFNKFYRAPDLSHVKGLGLGLYFTRKVIEGHYGHIKVSSVPGIGTDFIIDLPINSIVS